MDNPLYTPTWPIAGHEWAIHRLVSSLNAGRLRHAYLITGPAGVGKTTFARAFAQAANCLSDSGRPCGHCRACTLIAKDAHADVSILQAEGSSLKIEQVRDMQVLLSLRPVEGRHRVVILRRFHEASAQAMDALLKTLEEPPPYVLLILTADSTESLLPTIKSRCQPIPLRTVPLATIRDTLMGTYGVEPDRAALLAQLSSGRIGWAIRAINDETMLEQRTEWLDKLETALGQTRTGRFTLADQLSKDRAAVLSMLELWQSYWRDVLLMAHNAATPIANRDHQHALRQIVDQVKREDAYGVLKAIRRTTAYIEANVNARLGLEVLMLDLPRVRLYPPAPGTPSSYAS